MQNEDQFLRDPNMNVIKQIAQFAIRLITSILSLIVLLGVGTLALGALVIATLAVVLRVKWLQRKFSKQSDPRMVNAEKSENGQYTVSGV
jgi:thiol:disulfide interchange protein